MIDDGELRLQLEKGRVVRVEVGSGLATQYEDLFHAAQEQVRDNPLRVSAAIQVVVFGCLWLEAAANDALRAVLNEVPSEPAHADALWTATSGLRFQRKHELLGALTPSLDPTQVKEVAKMANRLFGFRDALVHFKPDHAEVPLPSDFTHDLDGLVALFLEVPESALIQRLKSDGIFDIADDVETVYAHLADIRQVHAPMKTDYPEDLVSES